MHLVRDMIHDHRMKLQCLEQFISIFKTFEKDEDFDYEAIKLERLFKIY